MQKIAGFIVERKKIIFLFYLCILVISVYGIFHVNVNYDMSKYLPDDSATKEGLEKMSAEFGDMSSITVMFEGLSDKEQLQMKEELESMPNVRTVLYGQDDEKYQKGNCSKYDVTLSVDTYSREAQDTLDEIKKKYEDKAVYLSGAVVDNGLLESTLLEQIPPIAVVAVIIIFAILFLMCDSWIAPFLYMGCIGVAILINMGSNAFLPSVSFMTFAIGALLQLGLSMDYSIMLMNRYTQEKKEDGDAAAAMKRALAHSFGAITSSSFTTIVGLLALVFMSFKIGQDMGVVLAKGVFISLICIFTLLPGLVVAFDKLLMKTHKKALPFQMRPVMKGVSKARFIIVPLVLILVIAAFIKKDSLSISFVKLLDNPDQERIEEAFGVETQTVVLYKNTENTQSVAQYIEWLEKQDHINSVQDYSNTIGKEYTYAELAEEMGMDVKQAKLMYQMYKDNQDTSDYEKITMYDLICYMDENIAKDPFYADFMGEKEIAQISDARQELEDGKQKISDARKELEDGEKEISDGEKKLADGEAELAENEQKLNDSEAELVNGEKEIAENEEKLADGEAQLAASKEQMKAAGMTEEQINAQLGEKEAELKSARTQLEAGKQELAAGRQQFEQGRQQIADAKEELRKAKEELENGRKKLADGKKELEENEEIYEKPMTADELADVMERDVSDVEKMLKIRRMSALDVEKDILSLENFLNFITTDVLTDETYADALDDDMRRDIADGQKEMEDSKSLLLGKDYNRMMISSSVPVEGGDTFALMERIKAQADEAFGQGYYLVGDCAMGAEMNAGFSKELNFVTLLTALAIFIVVILTFRSVVGSASLVILIQSAVYVTMAIVCMMGISVNYIALILVQCILMGATIDYGILLMSNYREARQTEDKGEALGMAMNRSIRTILTSSLILIVCCLSIGLIMTQKVIAQICTIIAYGAICSVVMVLFVLPAVLVILDKFIAKKRG